MVRRPAAVTLLIAMSVLPAIGVARQSAETATLAKDARHAVEKKWKTWTVASVDPAATACDGTGATPSTIVSADFDGDGQADFGALVKTPDGVRLVALLKRGRDYDLYDIEAAGDEQASASLAKEPRGKKFVNPANGLFDFYPSETLTASRCGQPTTAFIWTGSGFRRVQTAARK